MTHADVRLGGPPRVALLNGVCVRYDAISYSLRLKLDLLRELRDSGCEIEVNGFVQGKNLDDPDIHVRSLGELALDPAFARSNVVIYEFGIDYELFNSLFLLRDGQVSLGIYHNVTPVELVQMPHAREGVKRGLLLRSNLGLLNHVACDSEFNRQDLLDCGVPHERLSVLPLPPRVSLTPVRTPSWRTDPVEVLFVGRLVRAKGVHDLLEAVALLNAERRGDFRLTLAGSALFSDPEVMGLIRAVESGSESGVRIIADPDDETLENLYRSSAVLAIPSYH